MKGNPHIELQVATGGKENDLKLWDGNNLDHPVFQAKNVSPISSADLVIGTDEIQT